MQGSPPDEVCEVCILARAKLTGAREKITEVGTTISTDLLFINGTPVQVFTEHASNLTAVYAMNRKSDANENFVDYLN